MSRRPAHHSSSSSQPSAGGSSIYNYQIRVSFQFTTFESSVEYLGSARAAISALGDYVLSDASRSLKVLHYGQEIENPNRGFIAIVWSDPDLHIPSEAYSRYMARALARRGAAEDIWLDAESYLWGVLSSPVVSIQIIRLKKTNERDGSKVIPLIADWTSRSRKCEGYRDHWFNATINVEGDEFMVLMGWDGVEAQWQARAAGTEYASGFQRILQYATVDTRTVRLKRYSRFIQ
ncbi:hypothetical protein CPB85DRAFT_1440073 [Mucidula mucida]|nr:hypothetical protein CPB85DRAFT_1440073 [Mucidula mucida]